MEGLFVIFSTERHHPAPGAGKIPPPPAERWAVCMCVLTVQFMNRL